MVVVGGGGSKYESMKVRRYNEIITYRSGFVAGSNIGQICTFHWQIAMCVASALSITLNINLNYLS